MLSLSITSVVLAVIFTCSTSVISLGPPSSFYVVPLGTSGGLDESNLSAYLLTSVNGTEPNSAFITLDGGTIRHGIESVRRALDSSDEMFLFLKHRPHTACIRFGN